MTTTAEHLRNTLDGRFRDVKNRMRHELSDQVFRPHYTPNTVIARTKVDEQMRIMASRGAAEDGFKKEHGGNGDVGAAVTQIEMLAMSDLSLMVKAGVQWGLFGGAIENLGTERHHQAYVQKLIDLDLLGCFAMTDARIEEIYSLCDAALMNGQRFFRVHAFPFRMTEANMKRHGVSKWINEWKNLKGGYDWFEKAKRPPNVTVSGKQYLFSKTD